MKSFPENESNLLGIFINAYQDLTTKHRQEIRKEGLIKIISNSWSWRIIAFLRWVHKIIVEN
jgi:hypothetical protein